jgi:hypothetical protein
MTELHRIALAEAQRVLSSEDPLRAALSRGLCAAFGRRSSSKRGSPQFPFEAIPASWWRDCEVDCATNRAKFGPQGQCYEDIRVEHHPFAASPDQSVDARYDFVFLDEASAMVGSLPALERAIRDGTLKVSGIRLSDDSSPDPRQYTGIATEQICIAEIDWTARRVTHTWKRFDGKPVVTVYVGACVPRDGLLEVFPKAGELPEDEGSPKKPSSAGRGQKHRWDLFFEQVVIYVFQKGLPDSLTKFAIGMEEWCMDLGWSEIPDLRTLEKKLVYTWNILKAQ